LIRREPSHLPESREAGRTWGWAKFDTVEELAGCEFKITHIKTLARFGGTGGCTWSRNGIVFSSVSLVVTRQRITIAYRNAKHSGLEPIRKTVLLTRTPCHFGGERVWFCCPRCDRRTSSIFLVQPPFACRVCLRLRYESQREGLACTALSRALRNPTTFTGNGRGVGPRPPDRKACTAETTSGSSGATGSKLQ